MSEKRESWRLSQSPVTSDLIQRARVMEPPQKSPNEGIPECFWEVLGGWRAWGRGMEALCPSPVSWIQPELYPINKAVPVNKLFLSFCEPF